MAFDDGIGARRVLSSQADAYVDFILRGEGEAKLYGDLDYLRFFVSGYNINNCTGVLCNNGPETLTRELAERVLAVNARFHTIAGWLDNPDIMNVLQTNYRKRLNPEYRNEVERNINARQATVAATVTARSAELQR